jgi:hypothetical protein
MKAQKDFILEKLHLQYFSSEQLITEVMYTDLSVEEISEEIEVNITSKMFIGEKKLIFSELQKIIAATFEFDC